MNNFLLRFERFPNIFVNAVYEECRSKMTFLNVLNVEMLSFLGTPSNVSNVFQACEKCEDYLHHDVVNGHRHKRNLVS